MRYRYRAKYVGTVEVVVTSSHEDRQARQFRLYRETWEGWVWPRVVALHVATVNLKAGDDLVWAEHAKYAPHGDLIAMVEACHRAYQAYHWEELSTLPPAKVTKMHALDAAFHDKAETVWLGRKALP